MNILGFVPLYPPSSRVGAWITTHEYLAGLAARGHAVQVVVMSCNDLTQTAYHLDGVSVLPRTAEFTRPDVVVSHLGDWGQGALYAARWSVPSVRMVHGYADDNAERLDARPTALAVFASQALATATGWSGNQLVAHPPVHADRYRTEPGRLVTLSNLSELKGGDLFRRVATELRDVAFLGVEGGWGKQVAEMPPNVEVIAPDEDMRTVLARTRVLLMPSERESYGRCAVEAACSGIPTIAHPSPGLMEAMGDAAIWLDRDDLDAWVETIRTFQDSAVWQAASERASAHAATLEPEATISRVATAVEALAKVAA